MGEQAALGAVQSSAGKGINLKSAASMTHTNRVAVSSEEEEVEAPST